MWELGLSLLEQPQSSWVLVEEFLYGRHSLQSDKHIHSTSMQTNYWRVENRVCDINMHATN
jgi:hypothetical protein